MDEPMAPQAVRRNRTRRILAALASVAVVTASLTVTLGLSTLIGGWARASALVTEERPAPQVALTYTDAPDAGPFFEARDTVTVV
ncbi:MAG: hypothetical protein ACRELX_04055, partial [Longimicrobiales bacterium]